MAYSETEVLLSKAAIHQKAYRLMHENSIESRPPVDWSNSNRPSSTELRQQKLFLPYDGRYGPQSYAGWQLDDYFLIRPLVNEFVDGVLSSLVTSTAAIPVADKNKNQPPPDISAASESHVAPKIAELMFEVTDRISATVKEPLAIVSNQVNQHFAKLVQKAADKGDAKTPGGHGTADGLSFADSAIAQHQKERTHQGDNVWTHSQYYPTNFEPRNNAVSDSNDQSKVIDFNPIAPVGLHSVNGDTQQQRQEAQQMNEYRKREAEYFS